MTFEDPQLTGILNRLQSGQTLGPEDALAVYRSHDLHGIAQLANHVREQRHGNRAWARQDLQEPPMSDANREQRIAALLAVGEAGSFEPPLANGMSGHTYLKHVAVARLLLPGVDHLEVRLCPMVENVCQLALGFGADTLVGPGVAELERQILAAGRNLW
jgi:2-iminoacetate synthase ThiH